MKSVQANETILMIKNSKFICCIYPVFSKEEIEDYFKKVREKYPNATHYCYAYILDSIQKESDDGEPSGTAGIPILQVLEKNGLDHVLCMVVRYFGKIKLGAGGLVRAYTKSVVECLKDHVILLKPGFSICITFDYDLLKKVDHLVKETSVLEKKFQENVTYYLNVTEEELALFKSMRDVQVQVFNQVYLPVSVSF